MRLSRHLTLEMLEDRCTPATWGTPWPNAAQLTLSFAPDGTSDAGQQSQLFGTLNNISSTATWQKEILRAFQTWAVTTNINISVVGDGGQAFGSPGAVQGDSRFGDIRVGAINLNTPALAKTVPFDWEGGTWMGDMNLNTSYQFSLGGQTPGTFDLYTVALHEAGHAFGLPDNTDPTSVMDQNYHGVTSSPSAGDIAALQAIYGVRKPDKYEGAAGNNTAATAAPIQLATSSASAVADIVNADVTTLADKDYYTFNVTQNTGPATVELRTAGISSLISRVTVYDSAQHVLASNAAVDPTNGNLTLHFNNFAPGKYSVKVESESGDIFGIGGYQLSVHTDAAALPSNVLFTQQPVTAGLINLDLGNNSFASATTLAPRTTGGDARFNYSTEGSIGLLQNNHYYKLTTPPAGSAGSGNVMTVVVWGSQLGLIDPTATVYNAAQQVVPATVLVHDHDTYVVQVANAAPGATYYIAVNGTNSSNVLTNLASSVVGGNYYLGVDLSNTATTVSTAVSGTLTQAAPTGGTSLTVSASSLYHFILTAGGSSGGLLGSQSMRMSIYDSKGNVAFSLQANAGQTISGNAFLVAGNYTVVFAASSAPSSPLPFKLSFQKLTDNMDPYTVDSTNSSASPSNPSQPPPPPSGSQPPPPPPPSGSQPPPPPPPSGSQPPPPPPGSSSQSSESQSSGATWGTYSTQSQPYNPYSQPYMY